MEMSSLVNLHFHEGEVLFEELHTDDFHPHEEDLSEDALAEDIDLLLADIMEAGDTAQ